jgi:hypothetical protein
MSVIWRKSFTQTFRLLALTKLDDVQRIAAQPGWITEGMFLRWTEELFLHAVAIVWLDLTFRVAAWRILLRHVKAELGRDNRHPGWSNLARIFRNVRRYYTPTAIGPGAPHDDAVVTRHATVMAVKPYRLKVLACRHQADVKSLVASRFERRDDNR